MILVDTSYWIELINTKSRNPPTKEKLKQFAVCPPIVQEVIQGIRDKDSQNKIISSMLGFHCFANPVLLEHYLSAADIFSVGRRKGLTIRSSTDCLIAAIAIEYKTPILHRDRDFDTISQFTSLEIHDE